MTEALFIAATLMLACAIMATLYGDALWHRAKRTSAADAAILSTAPSVEFQLKNPQRGRSLTVQS